MKDTLMADTGTESIIANRYIVQDELGQGGMGIVYRVQDRLYSDNHHVALKRVLADQNDLVFNSVLTIDASTMSLNTALAEEFRILATLRHPHIISVLDYGFDNIGQPYYTMDLMAGAQNILEFSTGKPAIEKIHLVIQVLQALDYLHQQGIIHRDLKPNNVLVSNGQVKVLDFGLAIQKQDAQDMAITGTFAYLTPEVLQMQPASIASDLFSLGIILYEILVGQHPFHDQNLSMMVSNIMMRPVDTKPIELLTVPEPSQLAQVVQKLLDKNPRTRYQQAQQVIEDLCNAIGIHVPDESDTIRDSYLQAATFIGRETELASLDDALSKAKRGTGSIWLIGGESGVGKSRLVEEIRIQALVRAVTVLRGEAVSEGGTPYHIWKAIIRRMMVMMELEADQVSILKHILPNIDQFVHEPVKINDSSDYRKQLEKILLSMLQKLPNSVIILEDLQWADSASLELLQQISTKIADLPILLAANYRSDEKPELAASINKANTIMLERLNQTGIRNLAIAMLGEHNVSNTLIDLLQRETEGNLFFLVEVMRALADEAGKLRAISSIDLPQTVSAHGVSTVLERRLKRMPDWGQKLIQQAAIAGRNLDMAVIRNLGANLNLEQWLSICANVALFDAKEESYRFAHDKLREMLIDSLGVEALKETHQEVALAIETVHDSKEKAQILAFHWQKAGNLQKEFDYTLITSRTLTDLALHQEGIPVCQRLFKLYDLLKIDDEVILAELYFNIAFNYHGIAQHETAIEHYRKSLAIGEKLDDSQILSRALANLSVVSRLAGQINEALDYGERTIITAAQIGNHKAVATANINTGIVNAMKGNVTEAKKHFSTAKSLSEKYQIDTTLSTSLISIGILSGMMEEYDDAKAAFSQAMIVEQRVNNHSNIAACAVSLAEVHIKLAEYQDAGTQLIFGMQTAWDAGVVPIVLNALLSIADIIIRRDEQHKFDWAVQLVSLAKLHPQTDHDNQAKANHFLETYKEKFEHFQVTSDVAVNIANYEMLYQQAIDYCQSLE